MGSHPGLLVIALLLVAAVKFAGYSSAASMLSDAYDQSNFSSHLVAGIRVLMGAVVDASCIGMLWYVSRAGYKPGIAPFWLALVPLRLLEWWLLAWFFYDRQITKPSLVWKAAILGTLWSFTIDVALVVSLGVIGLILLLASGRGIGI